MIAAAAAGAIIGAMAFIWARWPDDAAASRAQVGAASASTAQQTAPAATRPAAAPRAPLIGGLGVSAVGPETQIALTDNQELIADSALRKVMDSFLLGSAGDKGLPALLNELIRRLPAAAARDAGQLATSYNAYIAAHDQLLAAQGFGATPDLNRLIGWQQQRAQLRDRMLGQKVSLEWFGTEDTYLSQALEELRQQRDGTAPPMSSADADEALHAQHMRQVLRDAIVRLRP
ncbi:MAG TPA: hypothetical protein VF670_15920 [Duganella sp.]